MFQARALTLSTLLIGGIICTPLFAFAQTSTTTAQQPEQAFLDLQTQTNSLIEDRMNSIPSLDDVRTNAIRDYLEIKTIPENPGPSEMVSVSVKSYLIDLNKAMITWTLDGSVSEKGVGKTTFVFKNGPSGKTTRLSVSITSNTGDYIVKTLSWNPVGLTIFWEADTYTPPFYRGKALLSAQAGVRAIAIPDITSGQNALGSGNFVYVWEKDGANISSASGYGKNTFSFSAPKPYEDSQVKVRASSINDSINSETRIKLTLSNPLILFYEKHPLLGVWYNRPFGSEITLSRKEFSLSAEPYFFSNEASEKPTLKYDWYANGRPIQNYSRIITLRNDTGAKGDSTISLAMRGIKQTFQSGSQELKVHFMEAEDVARPLF